jgi:large subunit ribosomal protein L23
MEILIKPIITEKMTLQGEKLNSFGFVVEKTANKIQIKKVVEQLYNVTVESVNTMRYSGKNKSRYTKTGMVKGKTNALKKAIVTLKKGDTIDFYSNI